MRMTLLWEKNSKLKVSVSYVFVISAQNDFDLDMAYYQWCWSFFDQREQEGPKQQEVLADML